MRNGLPFTAPLAKMRRWKEFHVRSFSVTYVERVGSLHGVRPVSTPPRNTIGVAAVGCAESKLAMLGGGMVWMRATAGWLTAAIDAVPNQCRLHAILHF